MENFASIENKVTSEEIRELAEALALFNQFPEKERIAIKYYLKGRLDAVSGKVSIPVELASGIKQSRQTA